MSEREERLSDVKLACLAKLPMEAKREDILAMVAELQSHRAAAGREEVIEARARIAELEAALNTPELHDFSAGVISEAQHQRERWGVDGDAGKTPADWFWLVGYLAGKALTAANAGNQEKALHHCVSTAAALANWHAFMSGQHSRMRPGIEEPVLPQAQP